MSDNITSFAQRERNQDFFSVFETSDTRLDLRWEDGFRCSLPYMHLHEIRFSPRNQDGLEEIILHYPAFTLVRIVGRHLSTIHEGLNAQRVSWVRERAKEEQIPTEKLCVDLIEYTPLTDWRLDLEALAVRRTALLSDVP